MAESTLSLGYDDFQREVARMLGYTTTAADLTQDQVDEIDAIIQSGVRQFYHPPNDHDWSFLRPTTTLALTADDDSYDMPDDFGAIDGEFTYASANNSVVYVRIVSEVEIRKLKQTNSSVTGFPTLAGFRPKASTGSTGQRQEVQFYPTPNGAYTLTYRYHAYQGELTSALPYPLGGMQHSETVLESILAIAEERKDGMPGFHVQKWKERLEASTTRDRKNAPRHLGYNGDSSNGGGYVTPVRYAEYLGVVPS